MKKLLAAVGTVCLLAACSTPKIDGSDEKTFKNSLQNISESLSAEENQRFQAAYLVLAREFVRNEMGKIFAAVFSGEDVSEISSPEQKFYDQLNGKDYKQITQEADVIMQHQIKEEKLALSNTVTKLEQEQDLALQSKKVLAEIKITKADFYSQIKEYARRMGWTNDAFKEHIVKFDIYNGTTEPISSVTLKGSITKLERSIPFFEGTFTASFPGGLEPKEKQHFIGELSNWSDWANAHKPKGSVLSLQAVEAYGANNRLLWKDSFGQDKEEELTRAKARLHNLTDAEHNWYKTYAQDFQEWKNDLPPWAQN